MARRCLRRRKHLSGAAATSATAEGSAIPRRFRACRRLPQTGIKTAAPRHPWRPGTVLPFRLILTGGPGYGSIGRARQKGGSAMIEVNGVAHLILTVSQWEKAHAFYSELLPFLGMTKVYDGNNFLYHVGGRTAIGIQRCGPEHAGERVVPNRVGLHHVCLRARSREDVEAAAGKVRAIGGHIDRGPMEGDFAPGYYYFVFEDPDGIRLEVNFVPGKGLLVSPDKPLSPSADPNWDQNPPARDETLQE